MDGGLNGARGAQTIKVNGRDMPAALTLGALARIEDEIGQPIGAIPILLKQQSIKVWASIAYWMLRAGGARIDRDDFLEMSIDPTNVGQAFGKALCQFKPNAPMAAEGKPNPIHP